MRRASIILAVLSVVSVTSIAAPPPEVQPKPMAPSPSRPSWMSGERNALSPPLRFPYDSPTTYRPSIWYRVERDMDRSIWRVVDTPTYELNHLFLERAANRPGADPELKRELFEYERDRQILLDKIEYRQGQAKSREEAMRRREYELWLNDGLRGAIGEQATADRLALTVARERRDAELTKASTPDQRQAIEQTYQAERGRILGVDPK